MKKRAPIALLLLAAGMFGAGFTCLLVFVVIVALTVWWPVALAAAGVVLVGLAFLIDEPRRRPPGPPGT